MDNHQVTEFTALWTQAQPSVFAFVSSAIANFSDAEDVLQRVATVAVTKFADYDRSRPFAAWVIGMARFEILRHLRERATDRHKFVADSLEHLAAAFEAIQPELDQRRRALARCLQRLEGRPREILEKRYAASMKTGAIAKLMGLTAGNVSVILNRTYRRLRHCVDGQLEPEAGSS